MLKAGFRKLFSPFVKLIHPGAVSLTIDLHIVYSCS